MPCQITVFPGVRLAGAIGAIFEINANHLRAKRDGVVTAVGTPLHQGRSTQVWQIELTDEAGKRVCVARCTLAVVAAE